MTSLLCAKWEVKTFLGKRNRNMKTLIGKWVVDSTNIARDWRLSDSRHNSHREKTDININIFNININNINSNINNINININMNNININNININNIKSNINRATENCFCLVWMFVPSPLA